MKKLSIVALITALSACSNDPVETKFTSNPQIRDEILMVTEDGYTIHRFKDSGHNVYFVTPSGSTHEVYNQSCGKGCTTKRRRDTYTGERNDRIR